MASAQSCATDALHVVFSFLPLSDFAAAAAVCRRWSAAVDSQPDRCDEWTVASESQLRGWADSKAGRHVDSLTCKSLDSGVVVALADGMQTHRSTIRQLRLDSGISNNDDAKTLATTIALTQSLTDVSIRYVDLHPLGATALASGVASCRSLTSFEFLCAHIGNDAVTALAHGIEANQCLTSLSLGHRMNRIGISALFGALASIQTMTHLELCTPLPSETITAALAPAIRANRALTTMHLEGSGMGPDAAIALALASALQSSPAITSLNLRRGLLDDAAAVALATAITSQAALTSHASTGKSTLKHLNLYHNDIGAPGAIALADAIRASTDLISLDLDFNRIGDAGAIAIAQMIEASRTIETIHLQDNLIRDEGALALAAAIRANRSLLDVNLGQNHFQANGSTALAATNASCARDGRGDVIDM